MNSKKCPRCDLVSFADEAACKRCGASLTGVRERAAGEEVSGRGRLRGLIKRALVVLCSVAAILLIFYGSLLKSSERPSYDQQQVVASSIQVLEQKGFAREAFVLRNFVAFRT